MSQASLVRLPSGAPRREAVGFMPGRSGKGFRSRAEALVLAAAVAWWDAESAAARLAAVESAVGQVLELAVARSGEVAARSEVAVKSEVAVRSEAAE